MSDDDPLALTEMDALALRIHRYLAGLERANRQANRRESHHLAEALRFLQNGQYEAAKAAMTDAERLAPIPPEAAGRLESNTPIPVDELRAALRGLIAGQA